MNNDSEDKNNGNSFEYRLREVSDEEIISILRYREHFQPTAVKAAIKEALKRGIISSIDDLEKDEFQPKPLPPRSLFPLGVNEAQNILIFRSLIRIFYGFGLLPIIFGIFQLSKHFSLNAIGAILSGMLVFWVANRLEKTRRIFFASLMLALNLPAMGIGIHFLTSRRGSTTMDAVAVAIVLLVLLYTTFYANKLTSHFNNQDQVEE